MSNEPSARDLDILVQLSSTINSSLDIAEVLSSAMRFVEELVDAEVSSIFELDDASNELFFRVAQADETDETKKIRMQMGEGVAGWVASSGEPLIVPDTQKDKRFSFKVDSITGFETKSIIALPIKNRGRLIGVLEALNKRGGRPFGHKDLEALTIVVNQIGIAIVNAKLYERIQEKFSLTQAELKRTQEQLLRSERLAALGQLSQGVAHEVRNPIMSIGGFARRIKNKLRPDDPVVAYVDIILSEADRLETMVKEVERYTCMPDAVIQPVKVSILLQSALSVWEKEHRVDNLEINLQTPPEDPIISVDKEQMAQALIELLCNSAEAMPDGGSISISARWESNWLAISVKDNGPGIAPEDLLRIFDPFFTAKTKGAGLGLTTVNRIVTNHGGEVKVSSKTGAGTEVKLRVPRFSEGK
jgi:signal transduction histidine kinase